MSYYPLDRIAAIIRDRTSLETWSIWHHLLVLSLTVQPQIFRSNLVGRDQFVMLLFEDSDFVTLQREVRRVR